MDMEFVFCYECEENSTCPDANRLDGCEFGLKTEDVIFIEYDKYLYDITLDGKIVGDQGDESFDTKDEAREDAEEYVTELAAEYNRPAEDFKIECYVGTVEELVE